jgi:hypothetical protein
MKKLIILLLLPLGLIAQNKYTISGYIRDAANGEELIGVNIVIPSLSTGATTNIYGYYSLSVPEGEYELEYQYIGYQTVKKRLTFNSNTTVNVELQASATQLQAVEVSSERLDKNVSSVEMSVSKLSAKEIQKVPQLLGETDIIRTLTLLPGITTVGEGSNGFNVRGGAADQNLILLDEAPVYNSSHLLGFFSIFNADAVKDVKVYKGGIPAQYGGRLSSVVDVRQKEGNSKNLAFNGGIGLLSSRLLVEAPIVKDKASFMVAGRRSYADIFLKLSNDSSINQNILYFYDLNAKVNWRISDKDRIYLSGYFGRDEFGIADLFGFDWGNSTATLRWNHLFSKKLFSNFSAVYSDYKYTLGTPDDAVFSFKLASRIQDYHLKGAFNYYVNNDSRIDFGFEGIYYRFSPGTFSGITDVELQQEYGIEPSAYISHEVKAFTRFTFQYGLRYSSFYKIGDELGRTYQNNNRPEKGEVVDSIQYASGELIEAFNGLDGLEPRIAVNYLVNENVSIKASYNRTRQYIHLISNTNSATPLDLYRSVGKYIDPATVHQYAAGYFQNFKQNMYEFSIEGYYKTFTDLVDYRNNAELIFNEYIETELVNGIGRAYGAEILLRKQSGKLTGWVGYTISRSERKAEGPTPETTINNGDWYASNYDKLHDLSVVANYTFNPKWDVGASFVFQTGRPYTPPSGKYEFEDITIPIYEGRNNARIPAYHRLDISATYTPTRKENKRFFSTWSFGVYNVYARKNAYSIFFQPESTSFTAENPTTNIATTQAVQLSIFATAIPFVTWNFNF